MSALVHYEAARSELAAAVRIDEVKSIHDKADAIRAYAHMAQDVELEKNAAELKLRAERRLGELLFKLGEEGILVAGRPMLEENNGSHEEPLKRVRLADLNVPKKLSMRSQKIAGIAERAFNAMVAKKREEIGKTGGRVSLNLVKEMEKQERATERAERRFDGGQIEDLYQLAASGFKAKAILADPAWQFMTRSERGEGRSASQHYSIQSLEDCFCFPCASWLPTIACCFYGCSTGCQKAHLMSLRRGASNTRRRRSHG